MQQRGDSFARRRGDGIDLAQARGPHEFRQGLPGAGEVDLVGGHENGFVRDGLVILCQFSRDAAKRVRGRAFGRVHLDKVHQDPRAADVLKELRAEPFIWWIKDLSAPDAVFTLPFSIPIYGSHVAILPILMVVSMFIQQRMMSGGAAQQPQQKTMQYFMTGFFFLMFNSFPSGLNLYYTLFNVLSIAQQKLIPPAETITK